MAPACSGGQTAGLGHERFHGISVRGMLFELRTRHDPRHGGAGRNHACLRPLEISAELGRLIEAAEGSTHTCSNNLGAAESQRPLIRAHAGRSHSRARGILARLCCFRSCRRAEVPGPRCERASVGDRILGERDCRAIVRELAPDSAGFCGREGCTVQSDRFPVAGRRAGGLSRSSSVSWPPAANPEGAA